MSDFKKTALTLAVLALIAVGTVTALKHNRVQTTEQAVYPAAKGTSTPVPAAEISNEKFLDALGTAGKQDSGIRLMAATRTPTPTPTEVPECTRLIAYYRGKEVVVGDEVDKQDVDVKGVFYNGKTYSTQTVTDFEIIDSTIYEVGENIITVFYEGQEATIKVTGKEPLEIVSITARYKGGSVIVSNAINRNDVQVYANYNWTDKASDLITNFILEPATVEAVGNNTIYVYYGDLDPVTIVVRGTEKTITSVKATYIGEAVYVGNSVDESDIEVLVTYNDGSETTVDNFTLTGQEINTAGVNYVVVSYKGHVMRVEVQGIERPTAKWNNFPSYYIGNGASTFVTLLVSRQKRAQTIEVNYVNWEDIDNCVNRVFLTQNYLGFEVTYTDPDAIMEFPIPCRVRRPDEFDPDNFAIFYTPNKETIMARVNGEYLDGARNFFVFEMEEQGTYIMVDMAEGKLVSSINVKETDIKLRVNRNYSIEPTVLPTTAGIKEVSYYSTDDNVATVSDKGKVKSIAPGECDIYIQAIDGSGVFEVIHVKVTNK